MQMLYAPCFAYRKTKIQTEKTAKKTVKNQSVQYVKKIRILHTEYKTYFEIT